MRGVVNSLILKAESVSIG